MWRSTGVTVIVATAIVATTVILMGDMEEDIGEDITIPTTGLIIEAIMAARMAATTIEVIMVDPVSGLASVTRTEEERGSKRAGAEA
jgi:hypothetical protein